MTCAEEQREQARDQRRPHGGGDAQEHRRCDRVDEAHTAETQR